MRKFLFTEHFCLIDLVVIYLGANLFYSFYESGQIFLGIVFWLAFIAIGTLLVTIGQQWPSLVQVYRDIKNGH